MAEENPRTQIGNEIVKLQDVFPGLFITEIYHENVESVLGSMEECDLKNVLLGYSLMFDLEPTFVKKEPDKAYPIISKIHDIVTEAIVDIAENKCGCQLRR